MMTPDELRIAWLNNLKNADRSPKTVMRYGGVVRRFLAWYEAEERKPVTLHDLTPIALVLQRDFEKPQ